VLDNERPLLKANIARLRLLFRECKGEAEKLAEIREELTRRRTAAAKELLKLVEDEIAALDNSRQSALEPPDRNPSAEEGSPPRVLSRREAAAQKRINELRMRLLDLTNNNRLLNYKLGGRSRWQIRLVDELPDQVLTKLVEGKRLVFKSLPEPPDESADEKNDAFILTLEQARRSDEQYLQALETLKDDDEGDSIRRIERALKDRVRATLGLRARRSRDEISKREWAVQHGINPSFDLPLPSNSKEVHLDGDIQTMLYPDEMERTLSAIHDQARSALQETGINTLYLAFGFLEWFEAPSSQASMFGPLLLHPVDLERKITAGR
jgi:Protein of unknown function (DUF4011)